MAGVLQERPAGVHAPDDCRVIGRGRSNNGQAHSRNRDLPHSVLVSRVSPKRNTVDRRRAFQVGHDTVGLLAQFIGVRPE